MFVTLSDTDIGWRAEIRPADHPVSNFDFDVVVGADGRRNTLDGEMNGEMGQRAFASGWNDHV